MTTPLSTYLCILISAALLWPPGLQAEDPPEPAPQSVSEAGNASGSDGDGAEPGKDESDGVERFLLWSDEPHRQVSNRLETLSRNVDSIFGEYRIYEEATETYLQLRAGIVVERGGSLGSDHKLRLKIDLPQTEERVKLVFESDESEESLSGRGDTGDPSSADGLDPSANRDYSAALQFFIQESRRWNVSIGPGIRIRTPPDPFARLRVRRTQDLGSTWQTRLTERLTEYLQRGLESRTTIEFERRTGKGQLFRLSSQVLWREEFSNDNTELSQGVHIYKRLTSRDSIAYGAAVVWETKPNLHHELYVADIRWRRRIHKEWLFLEIRPEVRFEREHHFRLDPSLTLSLEIMFGKPYLRQKEKQG